MGFSLSLFAQQKKDDEPESNVNFNKFRQLKTELATPNAYRTGSGAPGHEYWQQQADYDMAVEIDDQTQKLSGTATITYHNNSPDALEYLWLQLDQNVRAPESMSDRARTGTLSDSMSFDGFARNYTLFDGGFKIDWVRDGANRDLPHTVNETMMRVDLPRPLASGARYTFKIKWWYNINDRLLIGGRSGYEYFEADDNYLYAIAQFYPRMAVYNDVEGWQNKQFLGRGEFTLNFGDYQVSITVPADHIVAATGELQNAASVLSAAQRERLRKAAGADKPLMIVTPEEALEAEKEKSSRKKTWVFKARNVRDFGFASSRRFIWDAMGVPFGNRTVMAMSFYPKEGNPLWEQYSTQVVAHTLRTYSKFTFDYPYPVAISVHTDRIGMEYPMICFNGGRPEADGTYSQRTKYGMIGVIIHEVGHNFFPMIVNSDERQWTWMDEGLNTFVQFLTEQEWERDYPARRGKAFTITGYMGGDKRRIVPIMTNSESLYQFGNNAYAKPATALNILRETVMGRELFDFSFKTYARRWMFKQPTPADFFRSLEDASAVDLDWFWRGWFFTTDHVDFSLDRVRWFTVSTADPDIEKPLAKKREDDLPEYIGDTRNKSAVAQTMVERYPELADFYSEYERYDVTDWDRKRFERYKKNLSQTELAALENKDNFYEVTFTNIGGLVMPLILELEYADGTTEIKKYPAEVWRMNEETISIIVVTAKEVVRIKLDPFRELADVDESNNAWPREVEESRFKLFKRREWPNPMQRAKRAEEARQKAAQEEKREE
ncbi:MAG: M1 family metallopeptidase [Calditrichaeota bacterium]|nr:M1 family metallopeptidase [Calditrichota bacterium]